MARWRLLKPHYLWTTDNDWEYKETNRDTGRQAVKRFPVPRYFNPEDPADWNERNSGETIVCHEGKGNKKDFIFTGPPTLDMEPMDGEAELMTAEVLKNCKHPIDSLPGDFTQSILNDFQRQIDAMSKAQPMAPTNVAVTFQEFNDLKSQVAKLLAENAKLRTGSEAVRK